MVFYIGRKRLDIDKFEYDKTGTTLIVYSEVNKHKPVKIFSFLNVAGKVKIIENDKSVFTAPKMFVITVAYKEVDGKLYSVIYLTSDKGVYQNNDNVSVW